jgi:uncharacterized protein
MRQTSKLLTAGATLIGLVYLSICGLLFLSQRSYIYYPVNRSADVPVFTLHRGDADVVVSTNNTKSSRAILYFGGNAEDVSQSITPLSKAFPGMTVYAMHYRSYGGSTGTPSESALVADGIDLFNQVAKEHPSVSIVGRSLGSGIAVQVAASKPIERLVLITPYNSIAELAAERFKLFPTRLILQNKYESWRYANQLRVPTTIIIAGKDQVIPNASSQKLANAFQAGVVNVVMIPNADHNNVSDFPAYFTALSGRHAHEN